MYVKLNEEQIQKKIQFIERYLSANNAADGSSFDSNANVTSKNVATLEAEINKDINIQINRALMKERIAKLFGKDLSEEFIRQVESHEIYVHDETSLKPYCASISMYPLLTSGLKSLGGESLPPKHLESFCGAFVNMVFGVSAQFAGAIATVEFLLYFDHFASGDYGEDYLKHHSREISNHLQHVVYALNQPAAARGYQSVFWNISVYDEFYFNSLFGDFVFPDGRKADWNSVKKLQSFFMNWFNSERTKAILTFPVVTAAMLTKDDKPRDKDFHTMCAKELSNGNSFFIYMSDSADSLASCCRLRNAIENKEFSYSLGAGGVATGSIKVITINVNRMIQLKKNLREEVRKIHKYLFAYRSIMVDYLNANMLSVYKAGFIDMNKQFLTIGINGFVEAAEFLGIPVENSERYQSFIQEQLKVIFEENQSEGKTYGVKFNTEFVPAENLGVKNANWDRKDGLFVPRDCYNSYFYAVESDNCNALDKMALHGAKSMQYLDGGSALHLNLEEKLSAQGYYHLISSAAKAGCNYWCVNVLVTICNDCNFIDKRTLSRCSKCESERIDHATRVIGYLKKISNFSNSRQIEAHRRFYHREKSNVLNLKDAPHSQEKDIHSQERLNAFSMEA